MMGRGHSWLGDLTPEPGGAAEVLPAYLSYCGFFFMSFSYRRSFLVGPSIF